MNHESKKKKGEKEVSAAGWESIYCSLVLILVALFALLVSYSTIDGGKVTNFTRGYGGSSKKYSTGLPTNLIVENPVCTGGNSIALSTSDITEAEKASIESTIQLLKKHYEGMIWGESVDIEWIDKGFKVNFGANVLFAPGLATVTREAYPYLDQIITIALKDPFFIRVEGYTDDVPINTPEFPSNWELSTARAVNVLRYFLKKKISSERLAAIGFSQYHPVESNDTPEGRQKNRRVEICFELQKNQELN
ncbi:MAG: OmpA family protein [Deltaproteobacteria bacterium]|nr:OmpA family protein [Deltaproteobacteria bacterium]